MSRFNHSVAERRGVPSAIVGDLAAARREEILSGRTRSRRRTLQRATGAQRPGLFALALLLALWNTSAEAQECGTTFLAQGNPSQLKTVDTTTNPFVYNDVGSAQEGIVYNGMDYRQADDMLYAFHFNTDELLRIDGADGSVESLGAVEDLPAGPAVNAAVFAEDGLMYVLQGGGRNGFMYSIDVAADPPAVVEQISLDPAPGNIPDLAVFDGLFYGVDVDDGQLKTIDPDTALVSTIGDTGLTGLVGAMISASNGVFGVTNNGTGFFRFDVVTGEATQISGAPGGLPNDGARCLEAPLELAPLAPATLEVDFAPLDSDGNDVFEPGEQVEMAPGWRNDGVTDVFGDGILSNFVGPEGGTYEIVEDGVGYGLIAPGQIESCRDTDTGCYELDVQMTGADRPAQHWDATVDEEVQTGPFDVFAHNWTLHLGDSFEDVARTHLFYSWIETLIHNEVTAGCTATTYCPGSPNTRGQMAVFVLRSFEGPEYAPPACEAETERMFEDVLADHLFCSWIEELARREVVAGCDASNYCPGAPVTRAQMAIFLLKTLEGSDYVPPECTGVFTDVECPSLFADWIEDLFVREITSGCTENEYCPSEPQTRGQMAVFLTKTFGLQLYGP